MNSSKGETTKKQKQQRRQQFQQQQQQHNLNQFQVAHHIKTNYQGINLPSESRKRRFRPTRAKERATARILAALRKTSVLKWKIVIITKIL